MLEKVVVAVQGKVLQVEVEAYNGGVAFVVAEAVKEEAVESGPEGMQGGVGVVAREEEGSGPCGCVGGVGCVGCG